MYIQTRITSPPVSNSGAQCQEEEPTPLSSVSVLPEEVTREILQDVKRFQMGYRTARRLDYEVVQVGCEFYDLKSLHLVEHTTEIDQVVKKLDAINAFRQEMNKQRDLSGKKIDMSSESLRKIVDRLNEEVPGILEKGIYEWNKKDEFLDRLDRSLAEQAKLISSPALNMHMLHMQENFNERNRLFDILQEIVKQYAAGMEVIIHNSQRRS